MHEARAAAPRVVTAAGFGISFLLGIVVAAYGPAIPYIVDRFRVPIGVGGLVVTAQFLGECVGIATIGLSGSRWTIGQRLVASVGLFSVGLIAAAIAPTWLLLLMVVFLLGYGAGGLLVLMNLYFATRFGRHSPAMLAFVSAAYGIGTFLGPELVAISHGYEPVLAGAGGAGLLCTFPFGKMQTFDPNLPSTTTPLSPSGQDVVLSFALLLLAAAGIEAGVGTWETTYLVAAGWSTQLAAGATSLYWGAFTLGRLLCAPLAMRTAPQRLLIPCLVIATLSLAAIRLHAYPPLAFVLVGLCAGPVFPVTLSWLTRVVPARTTAVTLALVGDLLGSALIPAALGGLIGLSGVASLPVGIATCAIVCVGMLEVVSWRLKVRATDH